MHNDTRDLAFVSSIAALARNLGVRTIAEFVEDEAVLTSVRSVGIDTAQGFYTGKPDKRIPHGGNGES